MFLPAKTSLSVYFKHAMCFYWIVLLWSSCLRLRFKIRPPQHCLEKLTLYYFQNYYGSRLETSDDLQTNAACVMPSRPVAKSACEALKQVHPDVCKRYSITEIVP